MFIRWIAFTYLINMIPFPYEIVYVFMVISSEESLLNGFIYCCQDHSTNYVWQFYSVTSYEDKYISFYNFCDKIFLSIYCTIHSDLQQFSERSTAESKGQLKWHKYRQISRMFIYLSTVTGIRLADDMVARFFHFINNFKPLNEHRQQMYRLCIHSFDRAKKNWTTIILRWWQWYRRSLYIYKNPPHWKVYQSRFFYL